MPDLHRMGLVIEPNPTADASVLRTVREIATNPWVIAGLGISAALFAAGGPQALLPGSRDKEEAAMRLLTTDGRFAPLANLLARRAAGGPDYPAQHFLRGAELRLTGTAADQESFVLCLLRSITGRHFASFTDLHAEVVDIGKLVGWPRRCLHSNGDPDKSCLYWFADPARPVDPAQRMHAHLREAALNPTGYYFKTGEQMYCTIRPLPPPGPPGQTALALQLRSAEPATASGRYRPVHWWISQQGPGGRALPWAHRHLPLPEAV